MEIALCDDAKSADRGKHPAFGAVDLVHAIPVSHWPTLTATWQVEAFREYISGIMLVITVALASATSAADAAVPRIATITLLVANIVTVPHSIVSTSQQTVGAAPPPSVLLPEYGQSHESAATNRWLLSVGVGWRPMSSPVTSSIR